MKGALPDIFLLAVRLMGGRSIRQNQVGLPKTLALSYLNASNQCWGLGSLAPGALSIPSVSIPPSKGVHPGCPIHQPSFYMRARSYGFLYNKVEHVRGTLQVYGQCQFRRKGDPFHKVLDKHLFGVAAFCTARAPQTQNYKGSLRGHGEFRAHPPFLSLPSSA